MSARDLLAALESAGWHHAKSIAPGPYGWTGVERLHAGWCFHRWSRDGHVIEYDARLDGVIDEDTAFVYGRAGDEGDVLEGVAVTAAWVQQHGVDRLRAVAEAVGVFTPAVERDVWGTA